MTAAQQVRNLNFVRDELLREYMQASGNYKVEILTKIMEIDEEIKDLNN